MPFTLDDLVSGPTPRAGALPPALGSLLGSREPEQEEGILSVALDYLDRPRAALSEAVGATQHGETFAAGLKRGWEGDAVYGSLGEQWIPSDMTPDADPMEEIAKGAARLGIDIVADPANLLFVGPGKYAVGGLLRGARALTKGMRLPQWMAQVMLPTTTVLKMFGGGKGRQAAEGVHKVYNEGKLMAAQWEVALHEQLKMLGLAGKGKAVELRKMADEMVRSGNIGSHPLPQVNQLATWITDSLKAIGGDVEKYTDYYGKGIQVLDPRLRKAQREVMDFARKKGMAGNKFTASRGEVWEAWRTKNPAGLDAKQRELYDVMQTQLDLADYVHLGGPTIWEKRKFYERPFSMIDNYAPEMLTDDALEALSNERVFSQAVIDFAKAKNLTFEDARRTLMAARQPARAANIEYARKNLMLDKWLEKDPLNYLPRYFERVAHRLSFGKEWGLDGARLKRQIAGAKFAGLDKRFGDTLLDTALGKYPSSGSVDNVARKIMGAQVMMKMGPLSTLSNLSQNANTIVREGGINFLKGVLRSSSKEGGRAGLVAYQRGIHDALMKYAGGQASFANKYLEFTGFNPAERLNRLLGANAGIVHVERLVARSKGQMTEELLKRGMTDDDLMRAIANGGKLPIEVADKIGFMASEATQHATHWKDIPLMWQSPYMRIAMQYKSFIYQQTRFLMREVLQPAHKYFASYGKEGTIAPLLRATATFGVSAPVVAHLRDQARGLAAQAPRLVGLEPLEHEPKEFPPDDWAVEILQDMMYVGGLGMAGDLVERATRRDFKGWLMGPTVGDLSDFVEGSAQLASRAYQGKDLGMPEKMWNQLAKRVPVAGTLLPYKEPLGTRVAEYLDALR